MIWGGTILVLILSITFPLFWFRSIKQSSLKIFIILASSIALFFLSQFFHLVMLWIAQGRVLPAGVTPQSFVYSFILAVVFGATTIMLNSRILRRSSSIDPIMGEADK
jgi:hypothetical protein